ncbi:MAG: aminotransferase class V-fold PLP-dependent enzyme [Bacteroidia bacterium]
MANRREIIKKMAALPFLGGLFGGGALIAGPPEPAKVLARDYFKELGIRTFINAAGTYTAMTGSLYREGVLDAISYASLQYVNLDELQDRVGERLASLLKCEAAMVTAGAASAITLGTAGVLTGMDQEKASRIPNDLTGMKSEVIIQKSHRVGYDHAIRNCGVKLIEVETRKEMEKAINDKTAMMWFLNYANPNGQVKHEEFIEIGKKYGIPTFIDCAADVPPVENLWKYTGMGFDLVAFSGGKGLRGPQSSDCSWGAKI